MQTTSPATYIPPALLRPADLTTEALRPCITTRRAALRWLVRDPGLMLRIGKPFLRYGVVAGQVAEQVSK